MKISDFFDSLHEFFNEKRFVGFTLSVIFIFFITNLFLSSGFTGGAESIWHYNYSHFVFKNPSRLFDIWAKPFYTLLSAPFAIFGFKAVQFFNILLALAAGLFSYLVAKELNMKQPILAIILCCFTPVFTYNVFSGLSEILFALITIVTSYLFLKNRYVLASVILSFLPFVRPEGIFLIPIFAFYLIYKKQYKALPFMLIGFLGYTIVGGLVNNDFLWIFSQNPYSDKVGIYGTGSFFQFIKRSPGYFGIPNEIFYVTGLVAGITLYLRSNREYSKEFFLVILPFFAFLLIHSFMWWTGLGNSQGSNRYMAAIVPLMAVMSTRGLTLFSLMFEILFKSVWIRIAALYIGIISVIHIPFAVQNYPIKKDPYNKLVKQTIGWVKEIGLDKSKIFFKDSNFPHTLGVSPFDTLKTQNAFNKQICLSDNVKEGTLIIYDERYFPLDGVEFDTLVQNKNYELQKVFEPEKNFKVYGRDYRIAVFKRIKPDTSILNQNRMIAYGIKAEFKSLVKYDFDRLSHQPDSSLLYFDDKNDTKCFKINSNNVQLLYKEFDLSTLSFEKPLELYLKLKLNVQDTLNKPLLFVVEVDKKDKQIYYNELALELSDSLVNNWENIEYRLKLTNNISFSGTLKTYFINRNKSTYLLDDYQLGYCVKR